MKLALSPAGSTSAVPAGQPDPLTVTTSPPLHYNATCMTAPRFDSGTFTAVVVRGGRTSNVAIQFTACGVYTVTRS